MFATSDYLLLIQSWNLLGNLLGNLTRFGKAEGYQQGELGLKLGRD
jgi:hypothetical protein